MIRNARRLVLLFTVAGVMFLVVLSGVALATSFAIERSFRCTELPCFGTSKNEFIV